MLPDYLQHTSFIHEALHTIGFGHEFNAPDSRKYVEIKKKNIRKSKQNLCENRSINCS